ncbi:MAG: hypothetical protein IKJ37_10335, partial [Kiritimatiellae bacterium]|nr:hypothetical protein [Kiritimatiellia bacterium]
LLIPEVIIGKDMTINALDWAVAEMERRYALFAKNHVVNINEFNKLEIVNTEYSFRNVFNDLVALTKARLGEKPLDFRFNTQI